jgi:hypothetical protein
VARDGRVRQAGESDAVAGRWSGRTTSRWKATVRESRRIGKGKQRAGGVVNAPTVVACDSGERKYRCIFLRNHIILKVERRRPVGKPRDELSGPNTLGCHYYSACSFRWFIVAESTVRWFVVREKHC